MDAIAHLKTQSSLFNPDKTPDEIRPWDRQKGESDRNYQMFLDRQEFDSIAAYADSDKCSLSRRAVYAISATWRWSARMNYIQMCIQEEKRQARRDAAQNHAQAHMEAWAEVADFARRELSRMIADGLELTPQMALAMLTKATDYQRLFAGEVQTRVGINVEEQSTEALEVLATVLEEMD